MSFFKRTPRKLEIEPRYAFETPEPRSTFDGCASKMVERTVDTIEEHPTDRALDMVEYGATLNCPKTLVTGQAIRESKRITRYNTHYANAVALELGKTADIVACNGCTLGTMTMDEAYTEARLALQSKQSLLGVLGTISTFSQPTFPIEQNPHDLR